MSLSGRAAAVLAPVVLLACGPIGPISGGKLRGEVVAEPVADWSFSDASKTIAVETRPADPYSVNVWAVADGPRLYVAAGNGLETKWAKNILADPNVRVRIDDRVYELRAVQVADDAEKRTTLALYEKKYDFEPKPEDAGKAVLFRLDPR